MSLSPVIIRACVKTGPSDRGNVTNYFFAAPMNLVSEPYFAHRQVAEMTHRCRCPTHRPMLRERRTMFEVSTITPAVQHAHKQARGAAATSIADGSHRRLTISVYASYLAGDSREPGRIKIRVGNTARMVAAHMILGPRVGGRLESLAGEAVLRSMLTRYR